MGNTERRKALSSPRRVLLVENDSHFGTFVSTLIDKYAEVTTFVTVRKNIQEAIALETEYFDVILTDLNLPDSAGTATVGLLSRAFTGVPVIALTSEHALGVACLESGAQDFLPKNELTGKSLARTVTFAVHRAEQERKIRELSMTDSLTGLLNRTAFEEAATHLLRTKTRGTVGAAFLFIDVNLFKSFNDTHGHEFGDKVLKAISVQIRNLLREQDILGRWGGDEFVVASVATDETAAHAMRDRIASGLVFSGVGEYDAVSVTCSVGLAYSSTNISFSELLRAADGDMYKKKRLAPVF